MAKHIGVVIFQNGDRHFFIYNAFNDTAWPELFTTRPLAEAAWEAHRDGRYDPFAIDRTATTDSEPVALYSWDDMPDAGREPDFFTTASRLASAITGPITLEDAMQDAPQPQKPADFRFSIDITGSACEPLPPLCQKSGLLIEDHAIQIPAGDWFISPNGWLCKPIKRTIDTALVWFWRANETISVPAAQFDTTYKPF